MTKKEVKAALEEQAKYAAAAKAIRDKHAELLGSGEQGDELHEPIGDIEIVDVVAKYPGGSKVVQVYDARFGTLAQRFAAHEGASGWIAEQRSAWRRRYRGDAERQRLRSRLKAEFERASDLLAFHPYLERTPSGDTMLHHLRRAQHHLAFALLSVAPDGKLIEEMLPHDFSGRSHAEVAAAVIAVERGAARDAERNQAREARIATQAARRKLAHQIPTQNK